MIKFTNNASTFLTGTLLIGGTSLSVVSGTGSLFPEVDGTDPDTFFYITVEDVDGDLEIMRVTERNIDIFTVVRGEDGTAQKDHQAGDRVEVRPTAAILENFVQKLGDTIDGGTF